MVVGGQSHAPATLPPGERPFFRRLGGTQAGLDRCGKSHPTGIRSPTVQPVASCYTDYAHTYIHTYIHTYKLTHTYTRTHTYIYTYLNKNVQTHPHRFVTHMEVVSSYHCYRKWKCSNLFILSRLTDFL
jgi:hypothetical protein